MAKKTYKTEKNDLIPVTPTSDWKDPAASKPGKKKSVYTSGTMYQQETGRYQSPGLNGTASASLGHGKKKTPNVGAWNSVTVKKNAKLEGSRFDSKQPFPSNKKTGVSGEHLQRREAAQGAAAARYGKKKKR